LREWLRVNFNPSLDNNLWGSLSGDAKKILRAWLGAATYKDFETIVDLVLDRVQMKAWQSNQLRKRRDFWKNYSDNYLRLRILIPDASRKLIQDRLHDELGSDKDIGQLEQDGSEATEVCIFDFGTWYVVEFFRGSASEMRLFEATESLEHFFFGNQISISVRRLRALPNAEVFDHKYLWQPMCEQWLQDHNIYANEGLRRFLMSRESNWWQPYSRSQGLSYKQEDLRDRKRGVARWREKVQRLEIKARRWVQHANLSDVEADLYAL
ncbi:MAG: EH signature domain-containing protein, partial [Bacteroidota bacterium]